MVTSNLQLLTPTDGRGIILPDPLAQISGISAFDGLGRGRLQWRFEGFPYKIPGFACFPIFNQPGTLAKLFLGRRWELGAVNLGL